MFVIWLLRLLSNEYFEYFEPYEPFEPFRNATADQQGQKLVTMLNFRLTLLYTVPFVELSMRLTTLVQTICNVI